MRHFLIVSAVFLAPQFISASPTCLSESLSAYVALGAGGCMLGNNLFAGFATVSGSSGAVPISPANILLSPLGSGVNPGLAVIVNLSASAGTVREALFTFQVSGGYYNESSLTLSGSSANGDGAVSGVQNFCSGGNFGPDGLSGCTGTPGTLLTLAGFQNSDVASYAGVRFLAVTDDFTIDGGSIGSASAGKLTNQFAATPEPDSTLLVTLGLLFAAALHRKFIHRIRF